MEFNPCLTCGACCAWFRVSFYWTEGDDVTEGGVPVGLTAQVPGSPHLRCMRGTELGRKPCVALEGKVGQEVSCTIYPQRSSTCRDFPFRLESGELNPRCNALRAHFGLPPLQEPGVASLRVIPLRQEPPGPSI